VRGRRCRDSPRRFCPYRISGPSTCGLHEASASNGNVAGAHTADAIADSVPARDLLLSPDHAVLIGDVLIAAGMLVNGVTITQEPADEIAYRHVELSRHDIIFAEGLACASCADEHGGAPFENGGKVMQLHPRFAALASR